LSLVALPAFAGDYVPLREKLTPAQLREIALSDAQVEQLDAALRAAEGGSARPGAAEANAAPGRARQGAPTGAAQAVIGLDDAPIVARAVGRIAAWAPGTVFALDNGQRWQVLKGAATLRAPLDAPRVRVVPGFSGRWFLEVSEDLPKARVFLLD
jgi:hypothetical protein